MSKIEEKLETVYNFTVDYTNANGFPPSVREICEKCGIKSTSSAHSYIEMLKKRGLINKTPQKKRAIALKQGKNNSFTSIPVVGVIRAGLPIFAEENIDGYLPLPDEFNNHGNCFALKVKGDSMIDAGIFEGDTIIVQKCETAESGEIVVALVEDSATVKRLIIRNNQTILHPENEKYQDMIFDDILILGKVKGLIRKF